MWSVIPLLPILNFITKNNNLKKENLKYILEPISKQEMNYLISKNILKQTHGNYGDDLIVTGKFGKGRCKQRYLTTPLYNYLLRLQEKDKQDVNKIKDNQRYMFSFVNDNEDTSNSVSVS